MKQPPPKLRFAETVANTKHPIALYLVRKPLFNHMWWILPKIAIILALKGFYESIYVARQAEPEGFMNVRMIGILATTTMAVALAGCQSNRFSGGYANPAPLPAAPAGTITGGQLPPPVQPGTTDPSQFPAAPGAAETMPSDGTQIASLEQGAAEISTGSVAGVWNASVSGQSCRIATPQTRFGQGFRAGPLRCPAPLDGVKSWNVSGKQLALYDGNGGMLAQLYSSGGNRFDGQTTTGLPVSLSR